MRIQEEIKQKKFSTNFEKAVINLLYTHNWYRDLYKDVFGKYNLKSQHYNVLRILKGKHPDPSSPGEIKGVMLDKSPDLTRLLDKMVTMKLIERNLCPTNRRMIDILITKKGMQMIEKINKEISRINEQRNTNFTEADATKLSDLLDKFRS